MEPSEKASSHCFFKLLWVGFPKVMDQDMYIEELHIYVAPYHKDSEMSAGKTAPGGRGGGEIQQLLLQVQAFSVGPQTSECLNSLQSW